MKEKIRPVFIYNQTDPLYSGSHVDNTQYHFYFDALKRSPELELGFFPLLALLKFCCEHAGVGYAS